MATMNVRITGDAEIMRKLAKLGVAAEDVLEAATMAAATVIQSAASGMAPGPNIGQETTEKSRGRVTVAVGPTREKWYYRFFETGVKPHTIQGKPYLVIGDRVLRQVQHPGMAARPFLRPALDSEKDRAVDAAGAMLQDAVMREAR